MRISVPLFTWLAASTFCFAQQNNENMSMIERMDAGRNRAMAAINAGSQGKTKNDPSLESSFSRQTFKNSGGTVGNEAASVSPFQFDQKFTAQKFESGRSFFGIKNPWFGNKVYDSKGTALWSKSLAQDSDKKFQAKEAESRTVQLGKDSAAVVETPVDTKPYLAKGKAQGSVDQVQDKVTKEMTIEEVRELLNKNR